MPSGAGGAVVTGGGQGLGRSIALGLGEAGYSVCVADINGDTAERTARDILEAGGSAFSVRTDVTDEASVEALALRAAAAFGAPTVVVNNAAVFATLRMGPFTDISLDEWNQVQSVNVAGVFLLCRAFVPGMAERGYGKVINISSATIWTGRPNYLHYVTSKAALIGLTRALASEVGPMGIRVNAITPGSTRTEVARETITDADRARMAASSALRLEQTPTDLVGTVLFLASAASDFITGQTINVDGGVAFH